MKKRTVTLIAVVILAVIVLSGCFFTVREDEYACTVRFSKIIATTSDAGLHFKLPFVDSVKYFTKATQLYDIPPSEVLTSDKQNMTVDCYILWSIGDPLRFYQTLGSTATAEQRLYDTVRDLSPRTLKIENTPWRSEYLYSRAATIYGGTAEIQRNIIARRLLDLGKE